MSLSSTGNGRVRKRKERWFWHDFFCAGILWTLWFSLVPVADLPDVHIWDKIEHAVNYGLLAFLLLKAQKIPRFAVSASALVAFGILIELVQGMTGYRECSALDAAANTIGIGVVTLTWWLVTRRSSAAGN